MKPGVLRTICLLRKLRKGGRIQNCLGLSVPKLQAYVKKKAAVGSAMPEIFLRRGLPVNQAKRTSGKMGNKYAQRAAITRPKIADSKSFPKMLLRQSGA